MVRSSSKPRHAQARPAARPGPKPRLRAVRIVGGLIALDTAKVRDQALDVLQRAEQAFNELDQRLKEFESVEVQAFERWKYDRLGPWLSDLARVTQELDEADYHLAMAERESLRTGKPLWQAFESWQRKQERRKQRQAVADAEPNPEPDDRKAFFDALRKAAKGSPLGDLAEALGLDTDPLPFDDEEAGLPRNRAGHAPADVKPDVRNLYRKLCRLLHPDAAGTLSAEQGEIWHQVQEAYAARDAARLDTLLARVEHGVASAARPRTVAEIRSLAQHFRQAQAKLRSLLTDARRHPAWQFRKRDVANLARLEREFRRDIEHDLRAMAHRVAQIRAALAPRPGPAARRTDFRGTRAPSSYAGPRAGARRRREGGPCNADRF